MIDSMGKSNLSIAVSLTDIVETCARMDEYKSFHEHIVHVHAENQLT
jgi:hypothetical protein